MFPQHPGGRVLGIMAVFALALAVATFQIYEFLGCDQIYCWICRNRSWVSICHRFPCISNWKNRVELDDKWVRLDAISDFIRGNVSNALEIDRSTNGWKSAMTPYVDVIRASPWMMKDGTIMLDRLWRPLVPKKSKGKVGYPWESMRDIYIYHHIPPIIIWVF